MIVHCDDNVVLFIQVSADRRTSSICFLHWLIAGLPRTQYFGSSFGYKKYTDIAPPRSIADREGNAESFEFSPCLLPVMA